MRQMHRADPASLICDRNLQPLFDAVRELREGDGNKTAQEVASMRILHHIEQDLLELIAIGLDGIGARRNSEADGDLFAHEEFIQHLGNFLHELCHIKGERHDFAGTGIVDDLIDDTIETLRLLQNDFEIGASPIARIGIVRAGERWSSRSRRADF